MEGCTNAPEDKFLVRTKPLSKLITMLYPIRRDLSLPNLPSVNTHRYNDDVHMGNIFEGFLTRPT